MIGSTFDIFKGDSGSPFFIETDPNRYEVFGVVSFGDGCGRPFPGIYGRIAERNTLNWINTYMAQTHGDVCSDSRKQVTLSLFDELANLLPF